MEEKQDGKPVPGGARGRGKFNGAPRSERKSLEVFGGAPASTRYLPGNGAKLVGQSVPEGEENEESAAPPPPTMRIEPPWAPPATVALPKPNLAAAAAAGGQPAHGASNPQPSHLPPTWSPPKPAPARAPSPLPSPPSPAPATVASKLAEPEVPRPWEIDLDIPEYKPKPVIGSEENPAPRPVIRHRRSSSDNLKSDKASLAEERQLAIEKLKKQAEEDAKSDMARKIDLAKKMAEDAAAKGAKSPEKKAMSEDVLADRVAEWGLVLKADANTGKLQGVQTRRSGDRSSGDRR